MTACHHSMLCMAHRHALARLHATPHTRLPGQVPCGLLRQCSMRLGTSYSTQYSRTTGVRSSGNGGSTGGNYAASSSSATGAAPRCGTQPSSSSHAPSAGSAREAACTTHAQHHARTKPPSAHGGQVAHAGQRKSPEPVRPQHVQTPDSGKGKQRAWPTIIKPRQSSLRETDLAAFQNGVLLVDKPAGWTSFDVCGKLRSTLKFLGVKKVGHAGTLDPAATGLLVVCTGTATKFSADLTAEDKVYTGVIRLGEGTPSQDAETAVEEVMPWEHITDEQLQEAAARFTGEMMQVPPMYSALRVGGKRLYRLAREGVAVDRQPRPVTVTEFKVWRNSGGSSSSGGDAFECGGTPAGSDGSSGGGGGTGQEEPGSCSSASSSSTTATTTSKHDTATHPTSITGTPEGSRQHVHFYVECSKGTYIRTLAHDLGRALGTAAHLTALRREAVGSMHVSKAWQLQELIQQLQDVRGAREAPPAT